MNYNNFRLRTITISEANSILEILKSYKIPIIFIGRADSYNEKKLAVKDFSYSKYAIVKENDSCIWIETKYYENKYKATRYICNLNEDNKPYIRGMQAFNKLQQYCFKAVPAMKYEWDRLNKMYDKETGRYVCSAAPIIGFNPDYEKQELHDVWEYDLNSAYSSVMLDKVPYVNEPHFYTKVKKGQVGFYLTDKLEMTEEVGAYAEVVFDLIELKPEQKKYILNLYEQKETAVDELDYNSIKLILNAGIGYYQRWNPFFRAYIVHKCNELIKSLQDDDTILWNTDAIFSLQRRPELATGAQIGQFKETYIKRFAYIGNNYQTDYDLPKYRGIPKAWYPDGWDILKDPVPKRCNKFIFDRDKLKIILNEEYGHGKTTLDEETETEE